MDTIRKIYISGHRNPDVDSIAAATALAVLRQRQGLKTATAICPGIVPAKAVSLFKKFHTPLPPSINDIHLRMEDIMEEDVATIPAGVSLLEAVSILRSSGYPRLPVVANNRNFVGMLSPLNLLTHLLDIGGDESGNGLTSRHVHSSLKLIGQVIEAENVAVYHDEELRDFQVYVAAMNVDTFEKQLPEEHQEDLMIICGDRPEIHLRALQHQVGVMIITGDRKIEPLILKEAKSQQLSILRTKLDSATVIRRLKFSSPVEYFGFPTQNLTLGVHDRLRGFENQILNAPEDVLPVLDDQGKLQGVVLKKNATSTPPYRLIMVDHNEQEQSIPGASEIPVIEVVDHHRIGMMPTTMPIKFTGDIVGSTCTLVAKMFKAAGESLSPELAGILLGGLVTDTLNLKSPTTAPEDIQIYQWLEKISGCSATELFEELSTVAPPLASQNAMVVIDSDRKSYTSGKFHFSLSQIEETNLALFRNRKAELLEAMQKIQAKEKLDFIGLLVTDAVRARSELLISGPNSVQRELPYPKIEDQLFDLPNILSRKKQLLPRILAITEQLSR